jgi:hypothetical protein
VNEAKGTEEDQSSWPQFFDLRVANGCEDLSEDEYPPTSCMGSSELALRLRRTTA